MFNDGIWVRSGAWPEVDCSLTSPRAKLLIAVPLCLFAAIIEMPAGGRGLAAESSSLHLLGEVELTRVGEHSP